LKFGKNFRQSHWLISALPTYQECDNETLPAS